MPHPFRAAAEGADVQVCTNLAVPAPARRGRLRSRWRRRSLTDAAYPLRVRALRRGCVRRLVGHDHWACRPRSGRRDRRTGLYEVGSSPAEACLRPTIQIRSRSEHHTCSLFPILCSLQKNGSTCTRDAGDGVPYNIIPHRRRFCKCGVFRAGTDFFRASLAMARKK